MFTVLIQSSYSYVWLFATLWTIAHQAPRSMGILQEGILDWALVPSSRGSSQPRNQTHISGVLLHCRQVLYPLSSPGSQKLTVSETFPVFLLILSFQLFWATERVSLHDLVLPRQWPLCLLPLLGLRCGQRCPLFLSSVSLSLTEFLSLWNGGFWAALSHPHGSHVPSGLSRKVPSALFQQQHTSTGVGVVAGLQVSLF